MKNAINIKIAGEAGEGIMKTGLILSKVLIRSNFDVFGYPEYPSLIRGGHNTFQIHASEASFSQRKMMDLLIAFSKDSISLHQEELHDGSLILYDGTEFSLQNQEALKGSYLPIPFLEIIKNLGGKPVMANNIALGAACFLANLDLNILKDVIAQVFAGKAEAIISLNQKCVQAGFDYTAQNFAHKKTALEKPSQILKRIILSGNEAIGLGAIAVGMKFYSAYPMTPASSILHFLAEKAKEYDLVVKHAEDEISCINLALGASFAGVRAMTGTSGGGFCLMTESLGMAGIAEIPLVIVEAMRPGPALGMPTWTAQGDLSFVINASHDEFPRIVLAPGDVTEAFNLTKLGFELAEKYQLPVILVTDKFLSESYQATHPFVSLTENQRFYLTKEEEQPFFKRYKITPDGLSARTLPRQKDGFFVCNSYEHNEFGFSTEEPMVRSQMLEKRNKKLETIKNSIPLQQIFGEENGDLSLISWGSNKGPILEAMKELNKIKRTNFLHLNFLWPFPTVQVQEFLTKAKKTILIEDNSSAQLGKLIRQETGIEIGEKLLKYDGRPFWPEEIIKVISNL